LYGLNGLTRTQPTGGFPSNSPYEYPDLKRSKTHVSIIGTAQL
jgi:hypothetical protein